MLNKIFSTRNLIIFCVVCLLLFFSIVGWIIFHINLPTQASDTASETTQNQSSDLVSDRDKTGGVVSTAMMDEYRKKGLNPFGNSINLNELTDEVYQEYIHGMSHQKVKADVKWGFYEINKTRIQWLLKGLDKNALKYEKIYRDILTRWSKGDFSKAVEDHNAIWRLQGGTIGQATGILSPEAEKAYIESVKN